MEPDKNNEKSNAMKDTDADNDQESTSERPITSTEENFEHSSDVRSTDEQNSDLRAPLLALDAASGAATASNLTLSTSIESAPATEPPLPMGFAYQSSNSGGVSIPSSSAAMEALEAAEKRNDGSTGRDKAPGAFSVKRPAKVEKERYAPPSSTVGAYFQREHPSELSHKSEKSYLSNLSDSDHIEDYHLARSNAESVWTRSNLTDINANLGSEQGLTAEVNLIPSDEVMPQAFVVEDPITIQAEKLSPTTRNTISKKRPWWKRKKCYLQAILIIGLLVALLVFVVRNKAHAHTPTQASSSSSSYNYPESPWPSVQPSTHPSASAVPSQSPTACEMRISTSINSLKVEELNAQFPNVAVHGGRAVVTTNTGYVLFFRCRRDRCTRTDAANTAGFDSFTSLAIYGDIAVVGYPLVATTAGQNAGKVLIFKQNGNSGIWERHDNPLVPDDGGNEMARFGSSVSIYDGIVIVSAPCENGWTGAVYIFREIKNKWVQISRLAAPSSLCETPKFGAKVAIDQNNVVVTADCRESIHIYDFDSVTGGLVHLQDPLTVSEDVLFIGDVGLSENNLAYLTSSGGVFIYNQPSRRQPFNFVQYFNASQHDGWLGYSLSIHRDVLVIGGNGLVEDGRVYILTQKVDHWESTFTLDNSFIDGIQSSFGSVVTVFDRYVLVGCFDEVYFHNITECTQPMPSQSPTLSWMPTTRPSFSLSSAPSMSHPPSL